MRSVVPTKLRLKGKPSLDIRKIVRNAKRSHAEEPDSVEQDVSALQPPTKSAGPPPKPEPAADGIADAADIALVEFVVQPIREGTGKILTSLATVHGKDTNFIHELERGDTVIIYNERDKEEERREVTMVLSGKSLGIKEPFSRDIPVFTTFKYQKKPKRKERVRPVEELVEEELAKVSRPTEDEAEKAPTKRMVEYRTAAGPWTYKTVREEVDGEVTREQELDMRVKKSRDKFCWF